MTDIVRDDAAILAIGHGLVAGTLPKACWTHAAHLAAGTWLVRQRGLAAAERDMPGIIRAYNTATGVPNSDTRGYHATITLASLRAINVMLAAMRPGVPLYEAVTAIAQSRLGNKVWPLDHWSEALLFSPAARRAWVEPDRAALPF